MNNIRKVIFILAVGFAHHTALYAQDKIVFPDISYAGTPRVCVIGGIKVSGIQGYEDYMLTGISGLQVGQEIMVKVVEIDRQGRIRLTMKDLAPKAEAAQHVSDDIVEQA